MVYEGRKRALRLFECEADIADFWKELLDELKVVRAGRVGTVDRDPRSAHGWRIGLCAVRD